MTRLQHLAAAVLFAFAGSAFAQAPAGGLPQGQRPPQPPPSNLKVLPKDMTRQQVVAIMHAWEGELGVECEHCHAKNADGPRLNFASDANPMKDRTRVMMKMTKTINEDYLTQLTDPKAGTSVNCGTCHRGMSRPPAFIPEAHERSMGPMQAVPPSPNH